jgi:hypothetical protein
VVQTLGGVSSGDSAESVYSTWSLAHLNFACSYPPATNAHFPIDALPYASVSPLYPIISAVIAGVLRFGHSVPFPTGATMGAHCSSAYVAMYKWSLASGALNPTLLIAYLGWFLLMAGVIVLLRTSGRGRNGWEVVTVFLMAVLPPAFMCIGTYFHPQDLMAVGLILLAVAAMHRQRWILTGVLIGLAFASQPFALLALVPLFVVAPPTQRLRYLISALLTLVVVDGPLIVLTSGRALRVSLFGSSRISVFGHTHSAGGTVLYAAHLQGIELFLVARVLPVLCAFAIALWVSRRLGPSVLEIETLLSLLATALCMRLIFEENLDGYYFMAVAVILLCADVIGGRLRGSLITWIALILLAFDPIPWWLYLKWEVRGLNLFMLLPTVFEIVVVVAFLVGIRRHRRRWYLIASAVVVALTCYPPLWDKMWTHHIAPYWLWQLILVPSVVVLASGSLRSRLREGSVLQPGKESSSAI